MDLSNTDELQMIYLGFSQKDGALSLSVDGKEYKLEDFESSVKSIVDFVSTFSYNPIIAKIEVLDKKGFFCSFIKPSNYASFFGY